MAVLDLRQIAALALAAGWTQQQAAIATAIARAESSGDTAARGDVEYQDAKWGPSIGLWQIRSINKERGRGTQRDELANLDPATNARHAYEISRQGTYWIPWTVYTTGSYRKYLAEATLATGAPDSSGIPVGGTDVSGGASGGIPSILTDGGSWARVGLFILGGGLTVIALYRATGAGKIVAVAAKSAVKARTGIKL